LRKFLSEAYDNIGELKEDYEVDIDIEVLKNLKEQIEIIQAFVDKEKATPNDNHYSKDTIDGIENGFRTYDGKTNYRNYDGRQMGTAEMLLHINQLITLYNAQSEKRLKDIRDYQLAQENSSADSIMESDKIDKTIRDIAVDGLNDDVVNAYEEHIIINTVDPDLSETTIESKKNTFPSFMALLNRLGVLKPKNISSVLKEKKKNIIGTLLSNADKKIKGYLKISTDKKTAVDMVLSYFTQSSNYGLVDFGGDLSNKLVNGTLQNEFERHKDITTLLKTAKSSKSDKDFINKESKQEFIKFLTAMLQLENLEMLERIATNPLVINKVIEQFQKQEPGKYPTYQQMLAILDMILTVKEIKTKSLYTPFINIAGVAGAGKTSIVVRTVINYLEAEGTVDKKTLFVTGHTVTSTKNVQKVLTDTETVTQNLNALLEMSDEEFGKLSAVVIDESFAIPIEYFNALETKMKKAKIDKLPVLLLGDPSQTTNNPGTAFQNNIDRTKSIKALTLNYRAIIPSIRSFAKLFDNSNSQVKETMTVANVEESDLISDTSIIPKGSMVGKDSIVAIVAAQKAIRPDTTRAIIVASEAAKSPYLALADKHTLILTHVEAQGESYDEVYFDFNEKQRTSALMFEGGKIVIRDVAISELAFTVQGKANRYYNSIAYTALTRARKFSYMQDNTLTNNHMKDDNVNSSVNNLTDEIAHNTTVFKEFMTDLNTSAEMLDVNYKKSSVKVSNQSTQAAATEKDDAKTPTNHAPDIPITDDENVSEDESLEKDNEDAVTESEAPTLELAEDIAKEDDEENITNKKSEAKTIDKKKKANKKGKTPLLSQLKDKIIELFYPADIHFTGDLTAQEIQNLLDKNPNYIPTTVQDDEGNNYMPVGQGIRAIYVTGGSSFMIRLMAPVKDMSGQLVTNKYIEVGVLSEKDIFMEDGVTPRHKDLFEIYIQADTEFKGKKTAIFPGGYDKTKVQTIQPKHLIGPAFNVKEKSSMKFTYLNQDGRTKEEEAISNPNNYTFDNEMTRSIHAYEQGMMKLPYNQKHSIEVPLTLVDDKGNVSINPKALKEGLITIWVGTQQLADYGDIRAEKGKYNFSARTAKVIRK
jgi:hypothetical protein